MPQPEKKQCFFCTTNQDAIDYKDTELLRRFLSAAAKIHSHRKSGLCASHQRKFSRAVKRARYLALVPFTNR